MGIVHVLCKIVESTRLNMMVWKDGALPMLFHGYL
jgi:hypothetical protein